HHWYGTSGSVYWFVARSRWSLRSGVTERTSPRRISDGRRRWARTLDTRQRSSCGAIRRAPFARRAAAAIGAPTRSSSTSVFAESFRSASADFVGSRGGTIAWPAYLWIVAAPAVGAAKAKAMRTTPTRRIATRVLRRPENAIGRSR